MMQRTQQSASVSYAACSRAGIAPLLLIIFGANLFCYTPQLWGRPYLPRKAANKAPRTSARILTIGVVHGAVRNNMRQLPITNGVGHQNWGCVKADGSYVWVMVTLNKTNTTTINAINWNGQGDALAGYDNRYRRFGRQDSKRYAVKPTLYGKGLYEIYIWVIWATYQIRIDGDLDQTQNSSLLVYRNNQWEWPIYSPVALGGGTSLGPIDVCSHPSMTYRYAVGRTQGVAYLTPSGIEQRVNPNSWRMRRNAVLKAYDNGIIVVNESPTEAQKLTGSDNSNAFALDQDPTDNPLGKPQNTIYDLDTPGCPTRRAAGSGLDIDHTSETYDNFDSWAAVILNGEFRCSEYAEWSYKARLDGDLAGCKTTGNALYSNHIDMSNPRFYDNR